MRILPLLGAMAMALLSCHAEGKFPVGINLGQNSDYTPMFPFADAMKNARGWARVEKRYEAGGVSLNPQGWPLEDAAIVINAAVPDLAGVYQLKFRGSASVSAPDGGKIEDYQYDSGTRISTARVIVPEGQTLLSLAFQQTEGGVTDVELLRDLPADGPFTKAFLESLKPFGTLRFMDWMRINGSKQVSWADRTTLDTAVWTRPNGTPIEICIDLCNKLHADAWFCIPHLADEGYIREFARLVKSRLDPGLKVYVEYSNELWNFQFPQTNYFKAKATEAFDAKVRAGEMEESRRNQELYAMLWDMEALSAARALKIFRDEFADNARLIPVIGSQSANSYITKSYLRSGVLDGVVSAVAIAPYFGHFLGSKKDADRTLAEGIEGVFARLGEDIDSSNKKAIDSNAAIAAEKNLRLVAYEGGQHLTPSSGDKERDKQLNELFIAANRDPRMGEIYKRSAANWAAAGGGEFVYYSHVSAFGMSGYWGLIENMQQTSTPKLDAVKAIASGNFETSDKK